MPVSRAPGYIDLSSDGVMKATQKIYSKKPKSSFMQKTYSAPLPTGIMKAT